jgi:hypothetical protein
MTTVEHLYDNPFAHSQFFMSCPNCRSQAQLMRTEKTTDSKSEVRIYVCDTCLQKTELIVAI